MESVDGPTYIGARLQRGAEASAERHHSQRHSRPRRASPVALTQARRTCDITARRGGNYTRWQRTTDNKQHDDGRGSLRNASALRAAVEVRTAQADCCRCRSLKLLPAGVVSIIAAAVAAAAVETIFRYRAFRISAAHDATLCVRCNACVLGERATARRLHQLATKTVRAVLRWI